MHACFMSLAISTDSEKFVVTASNSQQLESILTFKTRFKNSSRGVSLLCKFGTGCLMNGGRNNMSTARKLSANLLLASTDHQLRL